ncbi:MAG: alpha/beta fold hydrolase [Candidatus Cloacimonadaceae bacterium]|nr:alpha/beta fold hydrolase [Candidatus Cloacimonadaceae bacterium]MDP3114914.1 alpha/beta fold hydrolase [Candidatus Cloacimonadaceae bacterium]
MILRKILIMFLLSLLSIAVLQATAPESFAGSWEGGISIMGMELPILVDFVQTEELKAYISIPAQGLKTQQLKIIRHESEEVVFLLAIAGADAIFSGKREGAKLTGSFEQAGHKGTFNLIYKGKYEAVEGKPVILPKGAIEEETFLKTYMGNLYGRMMLPEKRKDLTLVLMIAGSGPTDLDGNSPVLPGKNDSHLMMAIGLAENGIASLRYDKRGVGKSSSAYIDEKELRVGHFAADVSGWIELMRKDSRIKRIVVMGHSEGSLLGMLAAQNSRIDGFISLAGAGRKFQDVLRGQLLKEGSEAYFPEIEEILSALNAGKQVEKVSHELSSIFRPSVQPYLISMFETDPQQLISKLTMPVLIIQGGTDIQISVQDAELLAKANPKARYILIKGMNHVLKPAPPDLAENLKTYFDPDIPLADGLMQAIVEFCRGVE